MPYMRQESHNNFLFEKRPDNVSGLFPCCSFPAVRRIQFHISDKDISYIRLVNEKHCIFGTRGSQRRKGRPLSL
ncbi:hypothetical protein HMPREF0080_00257 [Anaeroglobus geminatus F0357]|uniref:Uncharacterized protein n=1 Tax=Anaeroglobus geminatus F0357 TaxID=861450 RepID=G9YF47_9FIRM|nr:hypothetical protein HMPREF0080_00257 [Anaeroglobus geminatus F0357]